MWVKAYSVCYKAFHVYIRFTKLLAEFIIHTLYGWISSICTKPSLTEIDIKLIAIQLSIPRSFGRVPIESYVLFVVVSISSYFEDLYYISSRLRKILCIVNARYLNPAVASNWLH